MNYTPGPWTLSAGRTFTTRDGEFYLSYGNDKHGNPKFTNFCALDDNARLIAAAPELLKALHGLMNAFEPYIYSETDSDIQARERGWLDQARAAIAKATEGE